MKKIFLSLICICTMSINFMVIKASNIYNKEDLKPYLEVLESVNKEYFVDYYILSENEYNEIGLMKNMTYNEYLGNIINQDINAFRNELINEIINMDENIIEVQLNNNFKSSFGEQTVRFNSGRNEMILEYKYSGSSFDVTYTPKVKVIILNDKEHFEMDSYTGKFKNTNKTYSVVAKGKNILASGIASNKTFTVNFNL